MMMMMLVMLKMVVVALEKVLRTMVMLKRLVGEAMLKIGAAEPMVLRRRGVTMMKTSPYHRHLVR